MNGSKAEPLRQVITSEQIQKRVKELGRQISDDYKGQTIQALAVLENSFMFLADLVRRLDMPLRIGFIQASSYRGATTSPGELRVEPNLLPDVKGHHVLLLDDILDTGQTLNYLVGHLHNVGAESVRVAVLLRKLGRQRVAFEPNYCGFEIPDAFVVGYGLDYNEIYRNLPYIGVLKPHVYSGARLEQSTELQIRKED